MASNSMMTPMSLKRRTANRVASCHPQLRYMEQRSHDHSIQTYSTEILNHLTNLESKTRMLPQLINSQPQISVNMRPILFDFLTDVHNRLKLSNATFFLMINIIDRYCSMRIVRKDHFQLLGLTALWLASKYSDSKQRVPTLDFLRATCCNCYSKKLFIEMECHILKSLNWEIGSPSHDSFIDLLLKEKIFQHESIKPEELNQIKYGAIYLSQLSQFYSRVTFNYSISTVAIASVILATNSLVYLNENAFVHYSSSASNNERLLKCCDSLLSIVDQCESPQSFKLKYFEREGDLRSKQIIVSIGKYSKEVNNFESMSLYYPSTPIHSTPIAYRTSSTSSTSSTSTCVSKESAASSLITPPTSCTASPVDSLTGGETNGAKPQHQHHELHRLSVENLRIQCPPSYSTKHPDDSLVDLERKRAAGHTWRHLAPQDKITKKNYVLESSNDRNMI